VAGSIKKMYRTLFSAAAKVVVGRYLQHDRQYRYKGLQLTILNGVFHPGFFFSTRIFAKWLLQQPLDKKKLLELGAGSGLLWLLAARSHAEVTASDISKKAVENVRLNAANNHLQVEVIQSDLFDDIPPGKTFDMVLINPPYYPGKAANDYQKAWYCGEDHEYFKKLFLQISSREPAQYYMILSEACDLEKISELAHQHTLLLNPLHVQKNWWETNTIYGIVSIS